MVRTRFAPSPTGQVHIGNMRTAIYSWLFARHEGGKFLLRVEDTDRERSTQAAVDAVLDAMKWLGLDFDEPAVYQTQTAARHLAAAEDLVNRGLAYREDKGGTGQGMAVVFRMPGTDMAFHDLVKGDLHKAAKDLPDFVIVRSNGTPVFHLANVVDDIDMGITHVIRGDDHVENTFRHIALYQALGSPVPQFAHLPMIVNAQGKPYSKRDGDAFIGDFREKGFLPQALFNYLTLLGWAPGDDRELFTPAELAQVFTLDRVHSSAAQMDLRKLAAINQHHLASVPQADYEAECRARLAKAGISLAGVDETHASRIFGLIRSRIRTYAEIAEQAVYFLTDDYPVDEKLKRKRLEGDEARRLLLFLRDKLTGQADFSAAALNDALHVWPTQAGVGPGDLMPALRAAVTGRPGGPDLHDVLAVLGRDTVLRRLARVT